MKNFARKTITTAKIAPVPDLGLNASTSFNGAKDNQRPFSPYRKRTAPFRSMLLTWLLMFVTVALFILTVYYALRPILGPHASWVGSSPSHAILLLRILSEGAGLFCAATVASSTECLQWMLVSRKIGLRLSTLLGLQTGTGVKGLLSLMIVSGIAPGTRLWSLVRLCFIAVVPILSVIIMSRNPSTEVLLCQTTNLIRYRRRHHSDSVPGTRLLPSRRRNRVSQLVLCTGLFSNRGHILRYGLYQLPLRP